MDVLYVGAVVVMVTTLEILERALENELEMCAQSHKNVFDKVKAFSFLCNEQKDMMLWTFYT